MAGIYIHIPFCRTKCRYCDFFSETGRFSSGHFISMLLEEAQTRVDFFKGEIPGTLYFGGGTPSVLNASQIRNIITGLNTVFDFRKMAEITIEVNPDDLNECYVGEIKSMGFNRISIGFQSVYDEFLRFLGRRHNMVQAFEAVDMAGKAGFENISIDLIYGIPGLTNSMWKDTLLRVMDTGVQHISAYHLTYEEGTPLHKALYEERFFEVTEEQSFEQFCLLCEILSKNGFEHYEISNFARSGFRSLHNSAYWLQEKYLGLGPSAHSYNGIIREWNPSSLKEYEKMVCHGSAREAERLNDRDHFNEFVMTRLRTDTGIPIDQLEKISGKFRASKLMQAVEKYIRSGHIHFNNKHITLSVEGMFISDTIISDLMLL